jgi:hypothetical protein
MNITTSIRVATAALIVAGALSPVALAGGEPKNEWPFTRAVADRSLTQVQGSGSQALVGQGEPKNQLPFTRPVAGAAGGTTAQSLGGEAKNDLPFTQIVEAPVVGGSDGGFDWGDAGIGAAAGLGIAALVAGGLLLTYPRGRKIGAAATR